MKHPIIVLLLGMTIAVCGQTPVITRTNYFNLNDKFLRIGKIDTGLNSIVVDTGGANVTWDYSSVDFAHPSVMYDTLTVVLPDSTPFFNLPSVNYDTSNLCLKIDTDPFSLEDETFIYYLADMNSVQFAGMWANNGGSERHEYHFTDLSTELVFPFTYNQIFIDSFESSYIDQSGSGMHYQHGSITVTADGYGTLINYEGDTIDNALRIKQEIAYIDSNDLFGTNDMYFLSYFWYSSDGMGPILQLQMDGGDPSVVMMAYYFKNLIYTSAPSLNSLQTQLSIYPNPAEDAFTVNVGNEPKTEYTLSIYSVTGKLMHQQRVTTVQTQFSSERLSSGMYFVELVDENGSRRGTKLLVR